MFIRPSKKKQLMFSVRIFEKEGGSGAFFLLFFFEIYFNRFSENIKDNLKHSLVQCETVRQFGPHRRILHFQTEQRYCSKYASIHNRTGISRFYKFLTH